MDVAILKHFAFLKREEEAKEERRKIEEKEEKKRVEKREQEKRKKVESREKEDALAKEIATERIRKEKEAREKKEAEEKERVEKREKERAEELAKESADEKTRKEKEAREKKELEEKERVEKRIKGRAEKLALEIVAEKARKEKAAREKKSTNPPLPSLGEGLGVRAPSSQPKPFLSFQNLPLLIGGGIIILFILGSIIKSAFAPAAPSPTEIPATATLQLPIEIPATAILEPPEDARTPIAVTPVQNTTPPINAQLGDTWLRPADDMIMSYIPAGEFQMGSEDGDDDEKPVHTVNLDAFWMDQTEVSNAQFGAFVEESGYTTEIEKSGSSYVYVDGSWGEVDGADWQHPQGPSSDIIDLSGHPVTHISWNDAKAYCEWADARLPSEAEWEKAARGGLGDATYPWGNDFDGSKVNFCDVNCLRSQADKNADDGYAYTSPTANFSPNGYGIHDMAGNLWEWTADWYSSDYYQNSPASNPLGSDAGSHRVLRGGSWTDHIYNLSSAHRGWNVSLYTSSSVGFRCSRLP